MIALDGTGTLFGKAQEDANHSVRGESRKGCRRLRGHRVGGLNLLCSPLEMTKRHDGVCVGGLLSLRTLQIVDGSVDFGDGVT